MEFRTSFELLQICLSDIQTNSFACTTCFFLQALYRFLEYFSKFDWDRYGISLNGPVDLSSLPNLTGGSYVLVLFCFVDESQWYDLLSNLIVIKFATCSGTYRNTR